MVIEPAKVLAALDDAYGPILRAFEQFHRQKNRFLVRYDDHATAHRFGGLVHAAHGWRHELLTRAEQLEGDLDSKIDGVEVADAIEEALGNARDLLADIFAKLGTAIDAARAAGANHTAHVLTKVQAGVDCEAARVEAMLRRVAAPAEATIAAALAATGACPSHGHGRHHEHHEHEHHAGPDHC